MLKKKLSKTSWILLGIMLVVAVLTVALAAIFAVQEKRDIYDVQVEAAERMQVCMDAIKAEKINRGIEIVKEDVFETGMLGEEYNFTTTTDGDLPSKRTTCDPNMAAMLVEMYESEGLQAGDTVGCNFSGSFPSLNIATLCACDAMGLKPVYIASCGASTWGANNQEFTFPEMAVYLYNEGLISELPVLITPGGAADCMHSVDQDEWGEIWTRVQNLGIPTMVEDDYSANLANRAAIFDEAGIKCFVGVGGNLLTIGRGDVIYLLGQGIVDEEIDYLNEKSGLIEYYLNKGTPAIFLLNIKKLVADYGMTFDPQALSPIGEASVYYETAYPVAVLIGGIVAELALLVVFKIKSKKEKIL